MLPKYRHKQDSLRLCDYTIEVKGCKWEEEMHVLFICLLVIDTITAIYALSFVLLHLQHHGFAVKKVHRLFLAFAVFLLAKIVHDLFIVLALADIVAVEAVFWFCYASLLTAAHLSNDLLLDTYITVPGFQTNNNNNDSLHRGLPSAATTTSLASFSTREDAESSSPAAAAASAVIVTSSSSSSSISSANTVNTSNTAGSFIIATSAETIATQIRSLVARVNVAQFKRLRLIVLILVWTVSYPFMLLGAYYLKLDPGNFSIVDKSGGFFIGGLFIMGISTSLENILSFYTGMKIIKELYAPLTDNSLNLTLSTSLVERITRQGKALRRVSYLQLLVGSFYGGVCFGYAFLRFVFSTYSFTTVGGFLLFYLGTQVLVAYGTRAFKIKNRETRSHPPPEKSLQQLQSSNSIENN